MAWDRLGTHPAKAEPAHAGVLGRDHLVLPCPGLFRVKSDIWEVFS